MSTLKVLTLEQQVEAFKFLEQGKSSRDVANIMGKGRTKIQNILKRTAEVLSKFESNAASIEKRKQHKTGNKELNDLCLKWFQDAVKRRINVTGPLLKEKALKFAKDLQNEDFKASNGWLESFVKRHNIVFGKTSGERGDVIQATVDEWKQRIPTVCEGYSPADIFNMDESGFFFRDTTRDTYHIKGDDCAGGKRSKERITVVLTASMTGEKLKPLLIGKYERPRCFSQISVESLPVDYKFNKKAWMKSKFFEHWLIKLTITIQ